MSNDVKEGQPWYKEPWAWFVLTPLIVVVIVTLSFVTVAVKMADDTVIDNYYKEGRMINQSLAQDKRAANWQLSVDIVWQSNNEQLQLVLHSPMIPHPEALVLWLDHPVDETQDLSVTATKTGANQYTASVPNSDQHWYLTLVPVGEQNRNEAPWRLKGEMNFTRDQRWTFSPSVTASSSAAQP
ncbi:FixH family protein [Gilvimarinus agarilyticus]|uniref:FixH family protein n=1 Tax=unclassified Gilvimarinus TaxID=2642066 RepID=UPI001C09DD3D|nr:MULTISPECIES: FixH family protein [unclassified Gilvimarinus]MBU2886896.1 FixH family protein [Gilvimarinus agarilyticus]MDO6571557.1 FixH family protein [Gilvimarinus sp. 2_MG-2023]MDO6747920.1 FixH family protein [Gilvimarinus sp. 1_MG-2023]